MPEHKHVGQQAPSQTHAEVPAPLQDPQSLILLKYGNNEPLGEQERQQLKGLLTGVIRKITQEQPLSYPEDSAIRTWVGKRMVMASQGQPKASAAKTPQEAEREKRDAQIVDFLIEWAANKDPVPKPPEQEQPRAATTKPAEQKARQPESISLEPESPNERLIQLKPGQIKPAKRPEPAKTETPAAKPAEAGSPKLAPPNVTPQSKAAFEREDLMGDYLDGEQLAGKEQEQMRQILRGITIKMDGEKELTDMEDRVIRRWIGERMAGQGIRIFGDEKIIGKLANWITGENPS